MNDIKYISIADYLALRKPRPAVAYQAQQIAEIMRDTKYKKEKRYSLQFETYTLAGKTSDTRLELMNTEPTQDTSREKDSQEHPSRLLRRLRFVSIAKKRAP